jgi:hypothetical protein
MVRGELGNILDLSVWLQKIPESKDKILAIFTPIKEFITHDPIPIVLVLVL